MKAVIVIQGLVQGVGYRFFAIEQAKRFSIKGYVQNLSNSNVEVVAEGNEGMLKDFIKKLKIGPPSAHVTGVDVRWNDEECGFTNFDVRF